MPLVSVVIPTHNRPQMLSEAVASVRAQTFKDYEVIIVSNGESAEMRRASREAASGCLYVAIERGNVSIARNVGISLARGEWIAFLDDDDLWLPHKLERQLIEAERTGADLLASDYVEVYPDQSSIVRAPRLMEGWTYTKALSHHYWWTSPSATIVRKSAFDRVGGFDANFRWGEDMDMWRRISWDHNIYQMEEILVIYRQGHPSAMQHVRRRHFQDLFHYAKMRRDTPSHLRAMLPTMAGFAAPRLYIVFVPNWMQRPLGRLKPRTRFNQFRYRLRLRTRAKAWLQTTLGMKFTSGTQS